MSLQCNRRIGDSRSAPFRLILVVEFSILEWRRQYLGSPFANPFPAIDCSNQSVGTVEAYVRAGVAPATRRAYRADLDRFEAWAAPAEEVRVLGPLAEGPYDGFGEWAYSRRERRMGR